MIYSPLSFARYFPWLPPVALVCFYAATSSSDARPTRSAAHHREARANPVPGSTPAAIARPDGGTNQVSGSDLVNGLPSSWRATLLDPPPPATSASSRNTSPHPSSESAPHGASGVGGTRPEPTLSMSASSQSRVLLPIPAKAGIAAFESGDRFIILIDNAIPMDTSAIHGDGIFASLSVSVLPDATVIQLRKGDTRPLYLSQQSDGWVLGLQPPVDAAQRDRRAMNPISVPTGILYPMRRSGRVLSIADPSSGGRLLVGTSLLDDGGIASMRRAPGYDVWPTSEGVVVASRDDDVTLQAVPSGLLLNRDGHRMIDDGRAVYANDIDLKWLALQDLADTGLRERLHSSFLAAADSSPAARFNSRVKEAQAAFSMGAFKETRGILAVALRDDPEEIGRPEIRFLSAATALMNDDLEEASALDGPWPESQQRAAQLWRALYLARTEQSDASSLHRLALDLDRLRSYPRHVRTVLLPRAAEAIAREASPSDLPSLNTLPQEADFQFARALANIRIGRTDAARRTLDRLRSDRDPVIAEKSAERLILLDRTQGKLTPHQAIHALDALILDARLAGREAPVRLAQAEAFLEAGEWQSAALMIDQGAPPDGPSAYSKRRNADLIAALKGLAETGAHGQDNQQALRNAALIKSHVALLPAGPDSSLLKAAYGKLLLSLGLADDASQALETAIPGLTGPENKAEAGLALARAYLQLKNAAKASAALDATDMPSISPEIKAQRDVARAEIALVNGDKAQSLSILKAAQSTSAKLMRVRMLENQADWTSASHELQAIAQTELPAGGTLSDVQQDLALRLASDAARAGDIATLKWLTDRVTAREMTGPKARIFALLTQSGSPTTEAQR